MMKANQKVLDMASEGVTRRLDEAYHATVEETGFSGGSADLQRRRYDGLGSKPDSGSLNPDATVPPKGISLRQTVKASTWNVRSLNEGKLQVVIKEMNKNGIDLLGATEIRWKGRGHFISQDGYLVLFSGSEEIREQGVAFILSKYFSAALLGYNPINSRLLTVRLQGRPVNVTFLVTYAPTSAASDEEIDDYYEKLQATVDMAPKTDILILLGDFNAKVGKANSSCPEYGKFGLGMRNERGERLIDFCKYNRLVICNTCFQQHPRRLYTWISPDNNTRNQTDYIMIQQRWRSSVTTAKTLPGADCGSDHQLLNVNLKIKLKKISNKVISKKLNVENIPSVFCLETKNRFQALLETVDEMTPEELWTNAKTVMQESASKYLKRRKQVKKPWIKEATFKLIEQRRRVKARGGAGSEEYRSINKEVRCKLRRDKQDYINEKCKEVEIHYRRNNTKKMYDTIRNLRQKFRPRLNVIKDLNGDVLTEDNAIKQRWKEYCENLFRGPENSANLAFIQSGFEEEPAPLKEEVEKAIKELKRGKSPGIDEIPAELIQATGESGVQLFHKIITMIWKTGQWPSDWKKSIFIPLPKKGDLRECSNYRTISLVSHASKILLKIILNRIAHKIEEEMPEEQAGFRKGRGTRDQILSLRLIIEKCKEFKVPAVLCFIDYSKAFDCVQHDELWKTLEDMGFPRHIIHLIKLLYQEQEATVRTNVGNTDMFKINKGVRQGCILSHLFSLYAEDVMCEALDTGVKINGRKINNLRYADDTTLICCSMEEMEETLKRVCEASRKKGLFLNAGKTKIMRVGGSINHDRIKINGTEIEVEEFDYLGSRISRNGSCSADVKRRLPIAKSLFADLSKLWKSRDLPLTTKLRVMDSIIFPVATYGCESWNLKQVDKKKIDAFEMWCYRRLLRISYLDRKTNEWVLKKIGREKIVLHSVNRRKLSYFGHIARRDIFLPKLILEGKVEGIRRPGRPSTRWKDGIKDLTGTNIIEAARKAQDRGSWKSFIMATTTLHRVM